jgi:hypothetical protein
LWILHFVLVLFCIAFLDHNQLPAVCLSSYPEVEDMKSGWAFSTS